MQQVASCGGKTCSVHKYLQVSATLKSIDYNVATTFILNNNNNNNVGAWLLKSRSLRAEENN